MSNVVNLISNFSINNQIIDLSIEQGKTYNKLILYYPSDLTLGTFYGQIRDNYSDENGTLLGEFSFETAIYDAQTEKTLIKPYLTASVTQDIPYTKYQGVGGASTKNCWVYDLEYHHDNIVLPLTRGFVQVIPEVTR